MLARDFEIPIRSTECLNMANRAPEAEKLLIEAQKAAPKSDTAKRIDGILKQYFGKKNSL